LKAIIFDLDGTLVDSSPGILAAFTGAFAACGLELVRPLTAQIIGPPLRDTLRELSGSADPALLDALTAGFKAQYDQAGYRETRPFPGVEAMLVSLAAAGMALHIATNKRNLPTRLILDHLGWTAHFDRVYALDAFASAVTDKAGLIARLLADAGLDPARCAYVGDRDEDAGAARANDLRFFWAAWGFGEWQAPSVSPNGCVLTGPDPRLILARL